MKKFIHKLRAMGILVQSRSFVVTTELANVVAVDRLSEAIVITGNLEAQSKIMRAEMGHEAKALTDNVARKARVLMIQKREDTKDGDFDE